MKFKIFNVDEWQVAVSTVFVEEVEAFELSSTQIDSIQPKIEGLMHGLIRDLERNFHKENSDDLWGMVKSVSSDVLGVFDEMHQSVPDFADRLVSFIDDPKQKESFRNMCFQHSTKVPKTFSATDYSNVDGVLDKWNIPNRHVVNASWKAPVRSNGLSLPKERR